MKSNLQADIDTVSKITAVPTILDVVCRTTGMGLAAVARVTEDRWIACSVLDRIALGLKPGSELKVEATICHEIRQNREPVIINNVADDPVFCSHPTLALYNFKSYISVPIIRRDGSFFGTLCAIDPKPAQLKTPETASMFKLFAELIAVHLDSFDQVAHSEESLAREREFGEAREKFIAILGHDLRNPLASVVSGTKMLMRKHEPDADSRQILLLMQDSLLRMRELIDNIADFARFRLGSGLTLDLEADAPLLKRTLEQVVDELRAVHPDRAIATEFAIKEAVPIDQGRIAQLLSNLIGNALSYGDAAKTVHVSATADNGVFELIVENHGAPIPQEIMPHLFEPFVRGRGGRHVEGLGLGLFIASEIAKGHGGTLAAASADGVTRFVFRKPAQQPQHNKQTEAEPQG